MFSPWPQSDVARDGPSPVLINAQGRPRFKEGDGGQYSSDDGLEHRVPIKSTLTGGAMAGTHHNPTHLLPHPDIYPHPSQHHRRGRSASRSGSASPRHRSPSGGSSPRGHRGQHTQLSGGHRHPLPYPREIQNQLEARNSLLVNNPEVMARRKAIAQAAFVRHNTADMMDNLAALAKKGMVPMPRIRPGPEAGAGGKGPPPAGSNRTRRRLTAEPAPVHRLPKGGPEPASLQGGPNGGRERGRRDVAQHLEQQQQQQQQAQGQGQGGEGEDTQDLFKLVQPFDSKHYMLPGKIYRHCTPTEMKPRQGLDYDSDEEGGGDEGGRHHRGPLLLPPITAAAPAGASPRHMGGEGESGGPGAVYQGSTVDSSFAFMGAGQPPPLAPLDSQAAFEHLFYQARQLLDLHSVPATPIALVPGAMEFDPWVPGTLNGIGHPVINDHMLFPIESSEPAFKLTHHKRMMMAREGETSLHGSLDTAGGGTNASSSGAPGRVRLAPLSLSAPLAPGAHDPEASSPTRVRSSLLLADGGLSHAQLAAAASPRGNNNSSLLPMDFGGKRQRSAPQAREVSARNATNDTLNLWKGKRLTHLEMKVEGSLHRLRLNPAARTELQERVQLLTADKHEEAREIAALHQFAAERREQKALQFLLRQSRYNVPGGMKSPHAPPPKHPGQPGKPASARKKQKGLQHRRSSDAKGGAKPILIEEGGRSMHSLHNASGAHTAHVQFGDGSGSGEGQDERSTGGVGGASQRSLVWGGPGGSSMHSVRGSTSFARASSHGAGAAAAAAAAADHPPLQTRSSHGAASGHPSAPASAAGSMAAGAGGQRPLSGKKPGAPPSVLIPPGPSSASQATGAGLESPLKKMVVSSAIMALFDPFTAEPVDDGAPLPLTAQQWWFGYVNLVGKLHALRQHIFDGRVERASKKQEEKAAQIIQAHWKGYKDRESVKVMREKSQDLLSRAAFRSFKKGQPLNEFSAARLILMFLQDREAMGRRGQAIAAMQQAAAGIDRSKRRSELIKTLRFSILLRQWDAVEEAACEVARKRTRGNATLGIQGPAKPLTQKEKDKNLMASGLAARKKGLLPTLKYGDEAEEAVRQATEVALSKTFGNDRVILEDFTPIPRAVKTAIISVFLEQKAHAYHALVGLTWRARAQYKADARRHQAKQAAMELFTSRVTDPLQAMQEELHHHTKDDRSSTAATPSVAAGRSHISPSPFATAPEDASVTGGIHSSTHSPSPTSPTKGHRSVSPDPLADPISSTSLGAGGHAAAGKHASTLRPQASSPPPHAPSLPLKDSQPPPHLAFSGAASLGYTHSPRRTYDRNATIANRTFPQMPHFRVLATPGEIKALMQQGVYETPIYNGYMLKGTLEEYEKKLTNQLLNKFEGIDEKSKKQILKRSKQQQGGGTSKITKLQEQRKAKALADPEEDASWTVAMLMKRWRAEAFPRTRACLEKRYGLLRVDLVECMAATKVWNTEELGIHLQTLVAA